MPSIIIKSTNLEMTEAIKSYIEKRLAGLDKILSNFSEPQDARVEVEKTTNHHKKGEIYRFEINLKVPGQLFRAEYESEDLYKSIDLGKDELEQQVRSFKEKLINKKRRQAMKE